MARFCLPCEMSVDAEVCPSCGSKTFSADDPAIAETLALQEQERKNAFEGKVGLIVAFLVGVPVFLSLAFIVGWMIATGVAVAAAVGASKLINGMRRSSVKARRR